MKFMNSVISASILGLFATVFAGKVYKCSTSKEILEETVNAAVENELALLDNGQNTNVIVGNLIRVGLLTHLVDDARSNLSLW